MRKKIKLGIWLDHSNANLMEINSNEDWCLTNSKFTSEKKKEALCTSKGIMYNKEQRMHEGYYKQIGKAILKCDHVLLFGPRNAKVELKKHLRRDLRFEDTIIDTITADNMIISEQHAFVDNHFLVYRNRGPL